MNIPDGYHTLTPYFFVEDAPRLIDFLVSAFDAVEVSRHLSSDGDVANAQVRVGNSMLMVSEATKDYPAMRAACYIFVEDADSSMAQALDAGGTLEMPVMDMPYGDRQGGVLDPGGNIWWVSQHLEDKPYS